MQIAFVVRTVGCLTLRQNRSITRLKSKETSEHYLCIESNLSFFFGVEILCQPTTMFELLSQCSSSKSSLRVSLRFPVSSSLSGSGSCRQRLTAISMAYYGDPNYTCNTFKRWFVRTKSFVVLMRALSIKVDDLPGWGSPSTDWRSLLNPVNRNTA